MNLTFKGFLRAYCRELTGLQTDSLKKLINASALNSPSVAEAVMVFASVQGKTDYAVRLAHGTWMEEGYKAIATQLEQCEDIEKFLCSDFAPERYRKVFLAYKAQKSAIDADRRVIALMHEKILDALNKSSTSIYSVCKQLGLNKGNIYAYLNSADVSKVSRDTARRILQFAESLSANSN